MIEIFGKFRILLDRKEQRGAVWLLLMSIVGAFFEMLGVSLVVPLMTAITEPELVTRSALLTRLCAALGIQGHRQFIVLCILAMLAVFILKYLYMILRSACTARFIYNNRFRMQQKMLRAFLRKPYEYYLTAQTGEILRIIRADVMNTYSLLGTLISLISESVVSLAIILVVVWIDPLMTLLIAAVLTVMVLIIAKLIKPILREEGVRQRANLSKSYKWLLQSVQGIKEIRIGGREAFFEERFGEAGKAQVASEMRYAVLNRIPRIILEMGCICSALIAMLVMILHGREPSTLLPSFAAFAMAAVKLMPAFNRILNAVSTISYHGPSIDRLIENSRSPEEARDAEDHGGAEITLTDRVECRDVTFRYAPDAEPILENASMTVLAGQSVGISGLSGAGKTTTVDVLLGLLKPEKGVILCDGVDITQNYRAWLEHVAYIPQSIFMLDGTIRENVIFGSPLTDDSKVWKALEDAKLADFVRNLKAGLDTEIGERGVRLSGGQRQRIGIARALYSDPELLVFDEATSSLDTETEAAIMEAIHALHGEKTMIIIAHRYDTIKNCDILYRVIDRKIERVEEQT